MNYEGLTKEEDFNKFDVTLIKKWFFFCLQRHVTPCYIVIEKKTVLI